ncbi:DUF6883 domain-containing protein [Methylobacterium radiotolerans]|uniref:DUF6883 domain-containing protein n=1 Tax=Methylobacterium radiotolerans TaxID=31998 RepID=UPI00399C6330
MTDDVEIVPVTWHIDARKISLYLTDLEHPIGGPKAKYLMRFGFTPAEPAVLANALVVHAMGNLPGKPSTTRVGKRVAVFEGTVPAPDGRDMPLRTVWEPQEVGGEREMHFVTAVPLTRRRSKPTP